ncbi:MAG: metal ABC transporter permease, partial [Deltaproteobacteria bacterium]|nr:metal ABC transporter permease [Deltaproteobacteria bacterium]
MSDLLFLLPALIAGLVLTGMHTYLGIHVISRGVIFLDIALAQIAALGLTLAYLAGYNPDSHMAYLFALGVTFIAAVVFSVLRQETVAMEAIIGVAFVVTSALSILVADRIPHGVEHLKYILSGNILWVTWPQIFKTALIYAVLGLFHFIFRRKFILVSTNPKEARALGISVQLWDLLFYLSFGLVITSSVQMAGILLVFSYLIMPALCSVLFFKTMKQRTFMGWGIGLV